MKRLNWSRECLVAAKRRPSQPWPPRRRNATGIMHSSRKGDCGRLVAAKRRPPWNHYLVVYVAVAKQRRPTPQDVVGPTFGPCFISP
jgi:hypothetical protein